LFEFHGSPGHVAEQVETVKAIADEQGCGEFRWANVAEERSALWKAQHEAYYAAVNLRPGAIGWATDVCADQPAGRMHHADQGRPRPLARSRNHPRPCRPRQFPFVFSIDPAVPAELVEVKALTQQMVKRALAMDGTCTGEHGIRLGRQDHLVEELGEAVDLMREIKGALDPHGLMNPGKIFA